MDLLSLHQTPTGHQESPAVVMDHQVTHMDHPILEEGVVEEEEDMAIATMDHLHPRPLRMALHHHHMEFHKHLAHPTAFLGLVTLEAPVDLLQSLSVLPDLVIMAYLMSTAYLVAHRQEHLVFQ